MVVLTGMVLTGRIHPRYVTASATFNICGEGLHTGGDVKLRGVLMGSIGKITLVNGDCHVQLNLTPDLVHQIPANVKAEVNAKTLFGEKWVELLYPKNPSSQHIVAGTDIGLDQTLNPIEVEQILNEALPVLKAINPDNLAGALNALAEGFAGHENAAIEGLVNGNRALAPLNQNSALVKKGIDQLAGTSQVLDNVRTDLLTALRNLDALNRFTVANSGLIAENLRKTPLLLNQLTSLFQTHFNDLTRSVASGATIIRLLAARTSDLDRLLGALPTFDNFWNANLNAICRYRQPTSEPGKSLGDVVPGRCWRVHNLVSQSQGAYAPGQSPQPRRGRAPADLRSLLYPQAGGVAP